MSRRELKRIRVLERVESDIMSMAEGARSLGITERQMRRLRKRYADSGAEGLIHGNRGCKPVHALSEEMKAQVVKLYDSKYSDSNFTHYSELLAEHEGITLSESSIGRILRSSGHRSKRHRKKAPRHHSRRERRSQAGMLWQIDATSFEWLGKENGHFDLHAAIDDATGVVCNAPIVKTVFRKK